MLLTPAIIGDLLVIVLFMFFSGLGVPYHDNTSSISWLTGFLINVVPYLLIWTAISYHFGRKSDQKWLLVPTGRVFSSWSATGIISELLNYIIVRYILLDHYTQIAKPTFPIFKIAPVIIIGWIAIMSWRMLYKFVHRFSEIKKSKWISNLLTFGKLGIAGFCLAGIAICLYVNFHYSGQIVKINEAPSTRLGVVFGAGVNKDGAPSIIMVERVYSAASLYNSGNLEELFLSSGFSHDYSEAEIMMEIAKEPGVPRGAIVVDTNGVNTYQTCLNAKSVIEDDETVILITHKNHLPRAMMICESLGVNSIGVIAEQGYYPPQVLFFWQVREYIATIYAYFRLL
jgi:SanA protein